MIEGIPVGETGDHSREQEFDQMMSAAVQDVLRGVMSKDLLLRMAGWQEEDTVRYCLGRMRDPHMQVEEERILAQLLMQATIVREIPLGAHQPNPRVAEILERSLERPQRETGIRETPALEPGTQAEVLSYLEKLEPSKGEEGLLAFLFALLTLNESTVQSKAALLIAKHDADFSYTHRLVRHSNARVRANAVEAIADREDSRVLEYLRQCAADPNNRVRANTAVGLSRRGDLLGSEIFLSMINHPSAPERTSGTWGLGTSGQTQHLPLVVALELTDTDERVRHHAELARDRIRQREASQP
jgi:hypothetical protein